MLEVISYAQRSYENPQLKEGSTYGNLVARYGQFSAAVNLEVFQYIYSPCYK